MILTADISCLDRNLLKKVLRLYALEHSFPIKFNKKSRSKTMLVDIAKIEEKNMRLRHSEEKLGEIFKTLSF